jgi:hypothetical protein
MGQLANPLAAISKQADTTVGPPVPLKF